MLKKTLEITSAIIIFLALTLLSPQIFALAGPLRFPFTPIQQQTPGDMCNTKNSDFAEYRYKEKIPYCKRNVSTELKAEIYARYGVKPQCRDEFTIDHFIPLSIGGSNSIRNLWPEHKSIKQTRFNLEVSIFTKVKSGELTQRQAINIIAREKLNPQIQKPNDFRFCAPVTFQDFQ